MKSTDKFKKLFLLLVLSAFSLNAFALGDVSDKSLSVGPAAPFIWQHIKSDDPVETRIYSFGLNLNYRQLVPQQQFGVFLDSTVYFPLSRSEIHDGTSYTTKFNDYDYFFGVDCLAGIYSVFVRSGSIAIPVGAGIHLDGMGSKDKNSNSSLKRTVFNIGTGIWGNCEFNFTKNIGVYGGVKVLYDFYFRSNEKASSSHKDSGFSNTLSFIPSIGMVFHF